MPRTHLSLNEARRIALAAQGFDRPRPARPGTAHVRRALHRMGLLQLDFVTVLEPAHYHVLFSRLGPYDRRRLDDLVYRRREFTEAWAHEASIVPMTLWPLLAYRRERFRVRPWGFERFLTGHPDYVDAVMEEVRARGPLTPEDLHVPDGVSRRLGNDSWSRSVPRAVLEAHFARGALAVARRRPRFTREYDLTERVVPREHLERVIDPHEAHRALLLTAARAHGVGTVADLADYFRMKVWQSRPRLDELVESNALRMVRVEGWREPAYLDPEARVPARIQARALLSPFDPVIWFRRRTARLFGFDYRMEVFVPAAQRRWGVYVLPFLLGDRLVARVDLKADRPGRRLLVLGAYLEAGLAPSAVLAPLTEELRTLAGWMGMDAVAVGRRGNLARALRRAV